ncbi:MAG: N-acetylmuramate alpha-1-phosphate uridylyltransferase MurU [Parashewanella sp.]
MKAMILAAGRGERFRPITDSLPKPLIPVNGKPLIEYHIERLAGIGIDQIIINTAWLGEMLPKTLGDGSRWNIELIYSHETQALETGGGIKNALPLLGESPFFVINADIYIDALPKSTLHIELNSDRLVHLWMVDNPDHNPLGDFGLKNQNVTLQATNKLTFSGMGVYHPSLFKDAAEGPFALAELLKFAINKQQVTGEKHVGLWSDVGTIERLTLLEKKLKLR